VRAGGLRVAPLPVDDRGARVEAAGDADAAIVTPAHQVGLGSTLAPERRAALAEWARERLVIEDDYDGEFRYDGRPVGALQALAPDHIVYAGTASKALSPALRIAWLVLPKPLVEPVVEAKRLADSTSPALDQLAFARLIDSGELDRHLRRMRARYRRRRDALVEALADRAPAVRVLGITALGSFWHEAADRPPALQAGYATPPDHAYDGAIGVLADVMRAAASRGS
jgi:GntR family transcriptional regulator/MocR family aminotransferase